MKKNPEETSVQQAKRAAWVERSGIRALCKGPQDDEGDGGAPKIPEHVEKRVMKFKETAMSW